jgi:prevent-host-death family protein
MVYNIHEAKTNLSRLVERMQNGETIIVAKAGRPMAQLVPFAPPKEQTRRHSFMKGEFQVPEDFNTMFQEEIIAEFLGSAA